MKKMIVSLAVLLMSLNSFAGLTLEKSENNMVPVDLIMNHVVKTTDVVTAKITTVFTGGAAGLSSIKITLYGKEDDSGSDYSGSMTYEINSVSQNPKHISLSKIDESTYLLSLQATSASLEESGFKFEKQQGDITISLDADGAVSSATMATKNK